MALIVTGANRGIGLGVAECCLTNGAARVYSIDIGETGNDFAALSKRFPGQLFALTANVTEEETITAAVDKIIAEAGALHGMVVNAGRTHHKAALDFTKEEIESLFNVNLFGAFYTARAAARAFIKLGIKGSVVFTASMASYRPNKVSRESSFLFLSCLLTCDSEFHQLLMVPQRLESVT
jgi:NAD(P)-dependent dehydrogenase (short-subunit alcohol dehydrogenase family)